MNSRTAGSLCLFWAIIVSEIAGCIALTSGFEEGDPVEIFGYDMAVPVGKQSDIAVKVERSDGFKTDVKGMKVLFDAADGSRLESVTDADGTAGVNRVFEEKGIHKVRATAGGSATEITVIAYSETDKFIISDIDHTLCGGSALEVLMKDAGEVLPLEGSQKVMNELAKKFFVIYLTARDDYLYVKTKNWLRHWGFPEGMLLAMDFGRDSLSAEKFKTARITSLGLEGRIKYGFGDRDEDGRAYLKNGITPFVLTETESSENGIHFAGSWADIKKIMQDNDKK